MSIFYEQKFLHALRSIRTCLKQQTNATTERLSIQKPIDYEATQVKKEKKSKDIEYFYTRKYHKSALMQVLLHYAGFIIKNTIALNRVKRKLQELRLKYSTCTKAIIITLHNLKS